MTIARDDKPTVYRFRFLSLLNLGLATVLLVAVVVRVAMAGLHAIGRTASGGDVNWLLLVALVLLSGFFLERRYTLYGMSLRVPFSMALGQLLLSSENVKETADDRKQLGAGGTFANNLGADGKLGADKNLRAGKALSEKND